MVLIRLARRWWTDSNPQLLMEAQHNLLKGLVKAPYIQTSAAGLNSVEFRKPKMTIQQQQQQQSYNTINDNNNKQQQQERMMTIVLAHGFGSGLGFFYKNIDPLLSHPLVERVILVDWLGMGGSERPQCYLRPMRRGFWNDYVNTTSWCDSRYSPSDAVKFFTEPFHEWMESQVVASSSSSQSTNHNGNDKQQQQQKIVLVGHSLGGYLSGRYVLDYNNNNRVNKLVLASPVGIPTKPPTVLKGSSLPTSLRILDALWSSNMTPQQLIRLSGSTRGKRNIYNVLRGRIPQLANQQNSNDLQLLAEYLYHITVADPSGEFAMNSLLEPVIAPDMMGVFAREPLHDRFINNNNYNNNLEEIKVIYGDNDWMRTNEPGARKTMDAIRQQTNGKIKTSVTIMPNAGHHLYYDNSNEFVRQILN